MSALALLLLVACGLLHNGEAAGTEETATATAALVENLPGQPTMSFSQYAGYLTVDDVNGRAFFYWLIEAADSPETKPLTLWLNGGPGCSSVGGGALSEIGPFFPDEGGENLLLNPNSWNQESNLLFLESPAGVGFSYSNNSDDYESANDINTAEDNYRFLVEFFKAYPCYEGHNLFIAGESYAGHYVPQLARLIVERNEGAQYPVFNLQGIMVGNPSTDFISDARGSLEYWLSHGLIGGSTYRSIASTCRLFSRFPSDSSPACQAAYQKAVAEMGNINLYNIAGDDCPAMAGQSEVNRVIHRLGYDLSGTDPCIDNEVYAYLNRREVQDALHANDTGLPYPWLTCSLGLRYSADDLKISQINNYRYLIHRDLRIWVYSGDMDAVVPFLATRRWLNSYFMPAHLTWKPWYQQETGQVAGWNADYTGIKFVTVRDAGHMVPYTQPERALILFSAFLHGTALPDKQS